MPVLLHEDFHAPGEYGLWHITETEEWLRNNVELSEAETVAIGQIKGEGRRREFLAARILLHHMSGRARRGELFKDESGKPHLRDSLFHVSISHTTDYAAAIAHPNPCGVDVQRIVPRIRRLANKFVGAGEKLQLIPEFELLQLHLIWSAKEAMYKAFGRRKIDFKQHLFVDFGAFNANTTTGTAFLKKGKAEMLFDLEFRIYDNFVLVGCVERVKVLL
ncbi:4'-phosphopantetheinyl transferase superfamily protein [Neolewinella aurantiaca]|uniref:4'-phosphopantetheinyl transferase superfamily protein n=1 Tax=Neolewinella aurantiaca TaxID=2602767 RepID=A0A5C7FNY8_9BACT|nr:4'-phosphopantetheinyl transferase superfamily protein [Neolewinella aurantiaca]TXF87066.1 4'-phosphopantetheinyl transferase superfamily protein [Neolewinella aurantiaca]